MLWMVMSVLGSLFLYVGVLTLLWYKERTNNGSPKNGSDFGDPLVLQLKCEQCSHRFTIGLELHLYSPAQEMNTSPFYLRGNEDSQNIGD